jgi:hypothetical protein
MPLRQPPAERSFSLILPKWNPVSNDRVLPHLGQGDRKFESGMHSTSLQLALPPPNAPIWNLKVVAREVLNTKTASTI